MNILQKINFRQPKYVLPAILYPLILGTGWLVIDMFRTEVKDAPDKNLEETEYLNPSLPQAQIRDDGIGGRTESMMKSYGRIQDYSAVENIDRNNEEQTEDYISRYSDEEFAMLDREAQARTEELLRLREMQDRIAEGAQKGEAMSSDSLSHTDYAYRNNQEALTELERALAEARLKGQQSVEQTVPNVAEATVNISPTETVEDKEGAVNALSEDDMAQTVVKAKRPSSSYFNTLAENEPEPSLIKAIIDEDIKAVDGSRVRLRLLDDVEINDVFLPKGSYLYATMSGFGQQRVKGSVKSLMVSDELVKVNLTIYDTDGMEGLYVPSSSFRETAKDVAGGALDNSMTLNSNTSGQGNVAQWGWNAIQNAYQKTSSAISKAIRKNKVSLKYGTFVYLVNGREKQNGR
ncbi:conjugative transposon protein TraM [uncultured Duncaniella sp.]|jgi:conjugative transposon TraM protein|uniref:conjugative transposon protein TraM n=1 Tax=uncultured Duncaniella sp. TaxID=2768039 RepID=UPI000F494CDE|nr:conjugative transposon protein TraM [uncultured Duncaniella sp.]ROS87190.1 conjugative transposon protein TraM [Muribaculaceae bacterium Isolate-080 (Janvier)]